MTSSHITSWQINGETMETVTDFIFLGSKITADSDYSQEIRRRLLLGRKAMTNLDSILKSRDITLPIKVCLVKTMVFPVVIYGCESWTITKAEHQRIDALATWYKELAHWKWLQCWERLKTGEGGNRGWNGWMASLTQWTWVWGNSGRQWRIGEPGVLKFMGL